MTKTGVEPFLETEIQSATKGETKMHTIWEVYIPSCKDSFKTLTVACSEIEIQSIMEVLMRRYEKKITAKKVSMIH